MRSGLGAIGSFLSAVGLCVFPRRSKSRGQPRRRYRKPGDAVLLPRLRRLVDERPTYGYRRLTALLNRELADEGQAPANHKPVYRLMKVHELLLAKHTALRPGRVHDGKVVVYGLQSALVLGRPGIRLLEWRHCAGRLRQRRP